MLAIGAFYAGKAFVEIATIEVFANDMRNDRSIKTVLLLEEVGIALFEFEKVVIEKLPKGGFLRLSSFIYTANVAAFHAVHLWLTRRYGSSRFLHFSYILLR